MNAPAERPVVVVVGAGGVGKTTVAAALGLLSAGEGLETLVMTFDPSHRLKDTLGVGEEARDRIVTVEKEHSGKLHASLLDTRLTFDRLVERYAPDEEARGRILSNPFYSRLAGNLAGVLEYMAVERLFEVVEDGRYDRIVLDTPPTRQALDFLEAPDRVVGFLESGALKIALKQWFDEEGRLQVSPRLRFMRRPIEAFFDRLVGLDVLRDMAGFFQAFEPLFEGFRQRALDVQKLLRSRKTVFVLCAGPGEEKIPDAMFFARRLKETGHHLGPVVVNRVHPRLADDDAGGTTGLGAPERALITWMGERDHRGLEALRSLLPPGNVLLSLPVLAREPTDLATLEKLAAIIRGELERVTPASP